MGRIRQRIQNYVDGVADEAARKAAKNASSDMVYELIAQLQTIGKDKEALAIIDKLGEVYFGYARLEWNGVLHLPFEHFFGLDMAKYKSGAAKDTYFSEALSVDEILSDLGRNGFEVVSSHPAGTGFDYFLKKRLYSRPQAKKGSIH